MRGSPLLRTFIIAVALVLTAWAIHRLLRSKPPAVMPQSQQQTEPDTILQVPFELMLSAEATSVVLRSADTTQTFEHPDRHMTGTLTMDPTVPAIFLSVQWQQENTQPHFAKLRIEPPQRNTLTYTFDAFGKIHDVWEPELAMPTE